MKVSFLTSAALLVALTGCSEGYDQLLVSREQKQQITTYCEQADKAMDEDVDNAKQLADAALTLAEKESYNKGLGEAHFLLGMANDYQGNYGSAVSHHLKGLYYRESIGDKAGMIRSYNNLAGVYLLIGLHDESRRYFEKGLEVAVQAGNKEEQAKIKRNLGRLFQAVKEYQKAEACYEGSLNLYKELDHKKYIGYLYNDLTVVQELKPNPNYEQLLVLHQKSLQANEQAGFVEGMGWSFLNIGRMYLQLGKPQQAIVFLQKAETLLQNDYANLLHTFISQIDAYKALNNKTEMLKALQKAESLEANLKGVAREGLQEVYRIAQDIHAETSVAQWSIYRKKEKQLEAELIHIREQGSTEHWKNKASVHKAESDWMTTAAMREERLNLYLKITVTIIALLLGVIIYQYRRVRRDMLRFRKFMITQYEAFAMFD